MPPREWSGTIANIERVSSIKALGVTISSQSVVNERTCHYITEFMRISTACFTNSQGSWYAPRLPSCHFSLVEPPTLLCYAIELRSALPLTISISVSATTFTISLLSKVRCLCVVANCTVTFSRIIASGRVMSTLSVVRYASTVRP